MSNNDYSSIKLSEVGQGLEERVRKAIARAKTVGERYKDSPDFSDHIEELETALPLTVEIGILQKEKSKIQIRKAWALVVIVTDAINDLNAKMSEYFRNKVTVQEENADVDEDEEELDIDAIFGDVVKSLDGGSRSRIEKAVKAAIRRKLNRRKNPKGTKVKRVPALNKPDISEIASIIGEPGLAKELTVEHPKPMFADLDRDEDTGVVRRKRVFRETPNCDAQSALEEFGRFVEEEDRRLAERGHMESVCHQTPRKTVFSTVEELERLVGIYTTKKLAAKRKLALVKHALVEANEKLMDCKVKELVDVLDFEFDNLKEKFEKVLDRRF